MKEGRALRQTSTITSVYSRSTIAALLGISVLLASCQNGKMPDEGSYAAQLYLKRCGQCHQAYNPSLMTAATWAVKVDAMQERLKQTGLTPLTPDERKTILGYLSEHAGQQ
jgi:Dihaem cytochrome c